MTSRLIAMTGPGGPMPPRRRLRAVRPGVATRCSVLCRWWCSGHRRVHRGRRRRGRPGRGSPRRSRCTAWSTPSPPARSRSPARRPGVGGRVHGRLHRDAAVRPGVRVLRSARPPLLLAAALAMRCPGSWSPVQRPAGLRAWRVPAGAGVGRQGRRGRRGARGPAAGSAQAVRLLTQAAQAAIAMSYQGEEVVTRWDSGGESVLVSDIWHVSGGQTVTQTLAAGTSLSSQPYLSSDDRRPGARGRPRRHRAAGPAARDALHRGCTRERARRTTGRPRWWRPGATTAAWPPGSGWTTRPSCRSSGRSSIRPPT